MTKKYSQEFRDRGVRLVQAHVEQHQCSVLAACREVAVLLGINHHTLREWVKLSRRAEAKRAHQASDGDSQQRIRELEAKVAELTRANEILLEASAFFAKTLDRPNRR